MHLKYICIAVLLFTSVALAAPPSVNLTSPLNNNLSHTENITFFCNATGSNDIFRISLYGDFNGSFGLNQTKGITELDSDENTTLLCHFDNSFVCADGQEGTTRYDTDLPSFTSSKFLQGVFMDSGYALKYGGANINGVRSTIEFWAKLGFNPGENRAYLLDLGDGQVDTFHLIIGGTCDNIYGCSMSGGITTIIGFSLETSYETVAIAQADVSGWNAGEWHHVAITWDTSREGVADIFLDGSNDTTTREDNAPLVPVFTDDMFIGTDVTGSYASGSVFDELRITNTALSPEEINASYTKGIADHRSTLVNFSFVNLPDGEYKWNCLAYDNASESNFSANSTIKIDMKTPPVVNYISFAPNSTDDIDPGVVLNFTVNVTDLTNVSSVILEYKYDANWEEINMTSSGNIWNANITTYASADRIYTYRFHVNDTLGNSNISANYTINVTTDYTWVHSPASISSFGLINAAGEIGNITINNTGDDTLNILLSTNWPLSIYYYNTTTNPFSIPAKSSRRIMINATFADHDSVSNMTITITATPSAPEKTAAPQSNTTLVTMNSYSTGSYITIDIATYPLTVNQSTNITLAATFRNIGNETASNIALNWTLPSGWANISGALNSPFPDIPSQATANRSEINVSVGTSSSGIVRIYFNVTKNGNETYSNYVNIQVACSNIDGVCGAGCTYNNDADCPAQTVVTVGGGGGGSGSTTTIFAPVYSLKATCPGRADVYRGQNTSFSVLLSNPEKNTKVSSIKLFVSGYPQALMSITPDAISSLGNTTKEFAINLNVPDYMKYGPYNVSITASGYATKSNTTVNATVVSTTVSMIIFVHSALEGETLKLIDAASSGIDELKAAGIPSEILAALIEQSRASIENGDYDTARDNAEKIIATKDTALRAKSSLNILSTKVDEAGQYGVSASEAGKMLSLAQSAFERGDYARSEERAITGLAVYDAEAANWVLVKKSFTEALPYSPVILGVFLFIIIIGRRTISLSLGKSKLSKLSKEEKSLSNLLKSAQTEFFRDNVVGKKEYADSRTNYEKRLAEIKREKVEVLEKISRKHGKTAKIMEAMKEAQHERFEKGIMSKKAYNETMRELKKELAETEKNKVRKKGLVSLFIILLFLFPCALAADNAALAERSISSASMVLKEMKESGMPIKRANDTLREASILYSHGDYTNAISMANYVSTLRTLILDIDNLIDTAEERIETAKGRFDISAQQESFDRALDLYRSEIFEESKALLESVINDIDKMETESSLKKTVGAGSLDNIIPLMQREWKNIAAASVATVIALIVFLKLTAGPRRKVRMRRLTKELAKIEAGIIDVQKKYFEGREISKSTYRTALDKYMEDLSGVKRKMAILSKH